MLKIGVLGAGHLGKIHLKLLKEISNFDLVGFYDPDPFAAEEAKKIYQVNEFRSIDELIKNVDVVDVVSPTFSHYESASKAIKKSKHVFIEKPITNTLKEAKALISLSNEAEVKVQVGHVERFNPAFLASKVYLTQPMFIESHRLAQFNPRGTDVSVVLDLMIHDIDIILSVVNSNIKKISANGVSVISNSPDIANARIEFDNGCVANITASRISLKNMRKTRFFQNNSYVAVDFLNKKSQIVTMKNAENKADPFGLYIDMAEGKGIKQILFESPEIKDTNAIKQELESFAYSIINNTVPSVSIDDGYKALDVAFKIIEKLKSNNSHKDLILNLQ
jgi:predicted dehydrogenase